MRICSETAEFVKKNYMNQTTAILINTELSKIYLYCIIKLSKYY